MFAASVEAVDRPGASAPFFKRCPALRGKRIGGGAQAEAAGAGTFATEPRKSMTIFIGRTERLKNG